MGNYSEIIYHELNVQWEKNSIHLKEYSVDANCKGILSWCLNSKIYMARICKAVVTRVPLPLSEPKSSEDQIVQRDEKDALHAGARGSMSATSWSPRHYQE